MVACWLMCDQIVDPRDQCHKNPPVFISLDALAETGVEYYHIPLANESDGLASISHSRGYNYRDKIVISPDELANYEQCIRQFFEEHLHNDEEIRYIRAGEGFFDVRSKDGCLYATLIQFTRKNGLGFFSVSPFKCEKKNGQDGWIRILSEPGDLLVLPAGIYHRFTVTKKNFVEAVRLFREPIWTPFNRSDAKVEEMEVRKNYLVKMTAKG